MKKSVQLAINAEIDAAITNLNVLDEPVLYKHKLRYCSAHVCETESYYYLFSYGTIVAFIDKETDTLYDILRLVYGYTSTSAQHISKFEKDYCRGKWSCARRLTYRPL